MEKTSTWTIHHGVFGTASQSDLPDMFTSSGNNEIDLHVDNNDIESESDGDDIVMGLMTGPSWRDDSDDDMQCSDADVAMDISDTEEVGERWWRYVLESESGEAADTPECGGGTNISVAAEHSDSNNNVSVGVSEAGDQESRGVTAAVSSSDPRSVSERGGAADMSNCSGGSVNISVANGEAGAQELRGVTAAVSSSDPRSERGAAVDVSERGGAVDMSERGGAVDMSERGGAVDVSERGGGGNISVVVGDAVDQAGTEDTREHGNTEDTATTGAEERTLCDQCGYRAETVVDFIMNHKCRPKFECPKCSKMFSVTNKSKHMKSCRGGKAREPRVYQCDQCVYQTHFKSHLKRHFDALHVYAKSSDSDKPKKSKKKICTYNEHIKKFVMHDHDYDERPTHYDCSWCEKQFRYKSNRNRHEKFACKAMKRSKPIDTVIQNNELGKLYAECENVSITDFNRILNYFRERFGDQFFQQHCYDAVSQYCNKLGYLHTSVELEFKVDI